jgi:uroporphyrinogen-III synthase
MTRDEAADGPMSRALRAAGLIAIHEPVLRRSVIPGAIEELASMRSNDWLVLTSTFTIEAIPEAIGQVPRVAVVGGSSYKAAKSRGFHVELVSKNADGASLFAELSPQICNGRVYYPRSSLAKPPAEWTGAELISPVLYVTEPRDFDRSIVHRVDSVAVASQSAARAIGAVPLRIASIGPVTSAALRQIGLSPWVEAREPSFESLAQAIADHLKS